MSKRADRRLFFESPMNAVIKIKDKCDDALITNLSCTGLCFDSKEQYKKGDKVTIELQVGDTTDLPRSIKAKILNEYKKTEDDKHSYGVRFFRLSYWYERNRIHSYIYAKK